MPTRRISQHQAMSRDGEQLQIITVYPEGVNKEAVKRENPFSKSHSLLIGDGFKYTFRERRA